MYAFPTNSKRDKVSPARDEVQKGSLPSWSMNCMLDGGRGKLVDGIEGLTQILPIVKHSLTAQAHNTFIIFSGRYA